jgi:hypothetical protein
MIRAFIALISLIAATLVALPASRAQVGFDRHGGDYTNFPARPADPAVCATRCDREGRCRAWSFSYPTADRPATCWLKSTVPPRLPDNMAASGVRGAGVIQPRHGAREFSIDRTGGDYRDLEVPADPNGEPCKAACDAEAQCRAWTYARPGYVGPEARCFLKSHVMPPRHKACCVSGVIR